MPGKSRGQRSLVGYSPWGLKESDMTERLLFHFQCYNFLNLKTKKYTTLVIFAIYCFFHHFLFSQVSYFTFYLSLKFLLKFNSYIIRFTHSKCTTHSCFSIVTGLCSHPHDLILKYLHTLPKGAFYPSIIILNSCVARALRHHSFTFCHNKYVYSGYFIFNEIIYIKCGLL